MSKNDRTAAVRVPLGGGVDDGTEPFVLQPPNAAEAQNMVAEKIGGLTKSRGYDVVETLTEGGNLLVAGQNSVLAMGERPPKVITEAGTTDLIGPGAPLPYRTRMRRVRAGKGFVHDVQLAHVAGYTCVAYNYLGDLTESSVSTAPLNDYKTEVVVLDSNWEIVYGPAVVPDMHWLPRVEVLTDEGPRGEPVFLVFGVGGGTPPSSNLSPFLEADNKLLVSHVDLGDASSLVSTSKGDVWPCDTFGSGGNRIFKLYDTVSDPDNECVFLVFPAKNGATREMRILRFDGPGTGDTLRTQTLAGANNDHMAIGLDNASDTVLVYDKADSKLWFTDASGLGAPSSASLPSLYDIDGGAAPGHTGLHAGDRPQTPEFYRQSGGLKLNERLIIFSGSSPGSPLPSSPGSPFLPLVYRPREFGGQLTAIHCGMGADSYKQTDPPYLRGASTLELYHLENHDGEFLPTFDLPLAESRLGDHNHRLYLYNTGSASAVSEENEDDFIAQPCVTGQTAISASGKLLVPTAFLSSQQKTRNSYRLYDSETNSFTFNGTLGAFISDMTDGAGFYNDEQVIGVCEISDEAEEASSLPLGETTLVAAGMVSGWSGRLLHPVSLRRPILASYDGNDVAKTGVRSLDVNFVSQVDTEPGVGSGTYYDWDYPFKACVVLVYTDSNGVEHRSPPSEYVDVPNGIADPGSGSPEDDAPTICPVVNVEVHPGIFSFFGKERALDIELYVTDRSQTESSPGGTPVTIADVDESTMTMVNRMPLQKDDTGYFMIDTLQDYGGRVAVVGGDAKFAWASPPHTNPLYTLTELAPDMPPAMHSVVQAGNYVFGLSAEDPSEVWVTKPLVLGRVPEFSSALTIPAPAQSGGVVSLASAYDRVFLLCRNGVWELPAIDGPTANGVGSFPPPRKVYVGETCVGHQGTVETPHGSFYLTRSGPRLVGASGGDIDVGRNVEDRLDWTAVLASVYLPEEDRVFWATEGAMVSYGFASGEWATHTLGASDVSKLGEDLVRVRSADNQVLRQGDTRVDDGSSANPFLAVWESPWIVPGEFLGLARIERVSALVRQEVTPTVGYFRISIFTDYDGTTADQEATWSADEIASLAGNVYDVHLRNQTAYAYKIRIEDLTQTVVDGQGETEQNDFRWTLAGLTLTGMPKNGPAKVEQEARR